MSLPISVIINDKSSLSVGDLSYLLGLKPSIEIGYSSYDGINDNVLSSRIRIGDEVVTVAVWGYKFDYKHNRWTRSCGVNSIRVRRYTGRRMPFAGILWSNGAWAQIMVLAKFARNKLIEYVNTRDKNEYEQIRYNQISTIYLTKEMAPIVLAGGQLKG